MLKELLNEFVEHEQHYPEFDTTTMVLDNYRLKPGLYIRLNNDGSMDEFYLTKKMDIPDNDPLVKWFKQADFASSLVEMNKPVDQKKKIHSNNMFSLFCKLDIFYDKGKEHPDLRGHIDRYFEALLSSRDTRSAQILAEAGYEPLEANLVKRNKERFIESLGEVVERIKKLDIKKEYIKIFLDYGEEDFLYENGRYLLPKIFNSNSFNVKVEDQVFGLSNTDMGMNAKKPYLEHKTTAFKVPFRITVEDAILLRQLYLWLNGQTRDGKPLYNGYIPVWNHDPALLAVANEVEVRKPVMYLHLERGIALSIDDFDFLPCFSDRMSRPIVFTNYLDAAKYQGGKINKLSSVEAHVNEYLYAFQLVRNYDVERIRVSDKLPQALANQIMLTREAMRAWFRKGEELPIRSFINKATMGVILARLQNLEYLPAFAHALNVRFSLLKFFSGEGNDMGLTIGEAYLELKDKVLKTRDTAACQNELEFYLAVGQLLRYFFSLSQAQSLQYDVLWRGITGAKNIEDVKKEYRKQFQRYAHDININNPRFNNMLSIVSSYMPKNGGPVNLDALFYGFAADNIIYYKDKEER